MADDGDEIAERCVGVLERQVDAYSDYQRVSAETALRTAARLLRESASDV